jgi:hypothetical protein
MTLFIPSSQSERSDDSLGWFMALTKTPAEALNTASIAKALNKAKEYSSQGRIFGTAQDLISTFARERWGQVLAYPPVTTVDAIAKGETALYLLSMMKGVPEGLRLEMIQAARALDAKLASSFFIESKDPGKVAEFSNNRAKAMLAYGKRAIAAGASSTEINALLRWLQYLLSDAVTPDAVERRQTAIYEQTAEGQAPAIPGQIASDIEDRLTKIKRRQKREKKKKQKQTMLLAAAAGIVSFGALSAWFAAKRKKESPNVA